MTTSATVVIPWRPTSCERVNALAWVTHWWHTHHPDYPVALGTNDGDGPWSKGRAVWAGLREVDTDLVIVADADVIVAQVDHAVSAIERGYAWAVPYRGVYRLTPDATRAVYDTGNLPATDRPGPTYEDVYIGYAGGGMVVLPTATARRVPIDPRFTEWGQEDLSWARALTVLAGGPWRSPAPLLHLWHPPQHGMTRGRLRQQGVRGAGSDDNMELYRRYRMAAHPTLMSRLVAEALELLEQ